MNEQEQQDEYSKRILKVLGQERVNLPSQRQEAFLEQGVQSTSGAGGVSGGDIRRGDTGERSN